MISNNIISLDAGILYGALFSVGAIVIETLIPTILNYSIAPKVSLKIDAIQLEKRTFHNVEGYLLTALVTNKGKKIALNLNATVQIKNEQDEMPKLLTVSIEKRNGNVINAQAHREEVFSSKKYAWIDDNGTESSGAWAQLRQGDHVNLLFPYEWHPLVATLENPVISYYETLLKLQKDISYKVIIEVKGENAEKTTEHGKASKKVILTK